MPYYVMSVVKPQHAARAAWLVWLDHAHYIVRRVPYVNYIAGLDLNVAGLFIY
jgi:hypothetical protein